MMTYKKITLQIAFASDDYYAQHLGSLIASILLHAGPSEAFHFYVLDGGISPENREKLCLLKRIRDCEISFLQPDFDLLADCPNRLWYTKNTYSRLLLPDLLPEVNRILYLDCDMQVRGSLRELWETGLDGKSLGVVKCETEVAKYWRKYIGADEQYFNAGMLLMDLEKIRGEQTFPRVLQWLAENPGKVLCADQDGLNILFRNDKKMLSHRWNWETDYSFFAYLQYTIQDQEYWEAARNPKIVHYVGKYKPWGSFYYGAFRETYWKSLEKTPWRGFTRERVSWKEQIKYQMMWFLKSSLILGRKIIFKIGIFNEIRNPLETDQI